MTRFRLTPSVSLPLLISLALGSALPRSAGSALTAPPAVWAIRNARVVPVAGAAIDKGTVVVRDGLIEAVGVDVPVPGDARVIDGQGLVVYPGLIDALSDIGLPSTAVSAPAAPGGRGGGAPAVAASAGEPVTNLNSHVRASDLITDGGARAEAARNAGFTTVLAAPGRGVFSGQSALVNLNGDRATMLVRSPVAMHIRMASAGGGGGQRVFPGALLGVIAYLRQGLLDARRYEESWDIYNKNVRALRRPETDRALEALVPVLHRQIPVVIPGSTPTEVERAIQLADEFNLSLILSGAGEGPKVIDLLQAKRVPVLLSLKFPEAPKDAHPDSEESLRDLQRRAEAPAAAAALARANIRFAFTTEGLAAPKDFVKSAGRAVKAGLSPEAALRAMTLTPAELFGAQEQLGSIEKGKIANLLVTDGDLFAEKTKVKYVFVDGSRFEVIDTPTETPRPRR